MCLHNHRPFAQSKIHHLLIQVPSIFFFATVYSSNVIFIQYFIVKLNHQEEKYHWKLSWKLSFFLKKTKKKWSFETLKDCNFFWFNGVFFFTRVVLYI